MVSTERRQSQTSYSWIYHECVTGSLATTKGTRSRPMIPDVRVYIGAGVLVSRYAIFVAEEGDAIEAFWVSIDLDSDVD